MIWMAFDHLHIEFVIFERGIVFDELYAKELCLVWIWAAIKLIVFPVQTPSSMKRPCNFTLSEPNLSTSASEVRGTASLRYFSANSQPSALSEKSLLGELPWRI